MCKKHVHVNYCMSASRILYFEVKVPFGMHLLFTAANANWFKLLHNVYGSEVLSQGGNY